MSIAGKSEQSIKNEIAVVKAFKKARFGSVKPIKAYTEVESGKRTTNRPKLAEAIQSCRAYKAKLVIAKLDRLSRDAHFLLGLEKAGIDFVATDMLNANRLTVGIMAMVAEEAPAVVSGNSLISRTSTLLPGRYR